MLWPQIQSGVLGSPKARDELSSKLVEKDRSSGVPDRASHKGRKGKRTIGIGSETRKREKIKESTQFVKEKSGTTLEKAGAYACDEGAIKGRKICDTARTWKPRKEAASSSG